MCASKTYLHALRYVRTHARTYVCTYLCMYVGWYEYMCIWLRYVCMYACTQCMHACTQQGRQECTYAWMQGLVHLCMHARVRVYLHVCMCVCIYERYVYVCMHVCVHGGRRGNAVSLKIALPLSWVSFDIDAASERVHVRGGCCAAADGVY